MLLWSEMRTAYPQNANRALWRKAVNAHRGGFTRAKKQGNPIGASIWEVYALFRDSYCCYYCGKVFESDEEKTLEHMVPIAEGGGHVKGNLCITHETCNRDHAGMEYLLQRIAAKGISIKK